MVLRALSIFGLIGVLTAAQAGPGAGARRRGAEEFSAELVETAHWLAQHSEIGKAKSWRRARTMVLLPALHDPKTYHNGGYEAVAADVLLSPDGKKAITFDGVEVTVGSEPVRYRGPKDRPYWVPPEKGIGGAAVYLALGREDEARAALNGAEASAGHAGNLLFSHASHRQARALIAQMQGRDREALAGARSLRSSLPDLREVVLKLAPNFRSTPGSWDPFQRFGGLPTLVADLQRRLREPSRQLTDEQIRSATVPDLIRELENHNPRSFNEYQAKHGNSAVAHELTRRGEESVPALVQAYQTDKRLTRSANSLDTEHLVTVAQLARVVLLQITELPSIPGELTGDRKIDPTALPRFFEATRGMSKAQRLVAYIQSDIATEEPYGRIYLQTAVERLFDNPELTRYGNTLHGHITDPLGPKTPWVADALTQDERKRLTQVLDRHIQTLQAEAKRNSTGDAGQLRWAFDLAIKRALLSPEGAVSQLRSLSESATPSIRSGLGSPNLTSYLLRVRLGDESALEEYHAWLRALSRSSTNTDSLGILLPLRDVDRDARYRPILRWLVEDPESPLARSGLQSLVEWESPVALAMGPVPNAIQDVLLEALEDAQPVGTATRGVGEKAQWISITPTRGEDRSTVIGKEKIVRSPAETWTVRRKDLVAQRLMETLTYRLGNTPPNKIDFSLAMSEADRDAAIARLRIRYAALRSR